MPNVIARQLTSDDLEPALVAIGLPILRQWQAAALRVAAHHANPTAFRLPEGKDTPEAILAPRFAQVANQRPNAAAAAAAKAAARLNDRRVLRRLGRGISLPDLATSTSLQDVELAPAAAAPTTVDGTLRLVDRMYSQLGLQRTTSSPVGIVGKVHLDLIRIVCVDETDGFLGSEAGEDEIYLSAATISESGKTDQVKPFKVGDFDDNTRRDFDPPRSLYTWTVGGGSSYPKHYFATLMLFEKDNGDLDETFEAIFRKFSDEVANRVITLLGGAVGSFFGGPLGAAAGAIIGWIVSWLMNKLVVALIAAWEDDPFVPRTLEFILPDATSRLDEPSKVFKFTGPGEYAVRYRWWATAPVNVPVLAAATLVAAPNGE
jgi:hypothetical protein